MAAPKTRTKAERETHLGKVTDFYCQGVRQCDIAVKLGVDPSQIAYDLRILMGRWQKASTAKIDQWKATELERINNLEREYWDAWQASIESGVKVSKERKVGNEVVTVKQEVTKASGDPRFLSGVQWCIERRCKLLGLDEPDKHEHGGAGGKDIIFRVVYGDDETEG